MSKKIAITSGKGGTGKTCVSVNLFKHIAMLNRTVCLYDCDVEEPNVKLFFPDSTLIDHGNICLEQPQINKNCNYCSFCAAHCQFNAISILAKTGKAYINKDICHSCGVCSYVCKYEAIEYAENLIGYINRYETNYGEIIEGELKIGSPAQTRLIKEQKLETSHSDIALYDTSPGTSCSVVESISGADFVVLVTESSPFGLYDLKLSVELLRSLNLKFGVVINKHIANNIIESYLEEENIELLACLPFNNKYAEYYSKAKIMNNEASLFSNIYSDLAISVLSKLESA
ncbi:MAG: ATP-binding protein [Marinifilaceae bacterium]|jgi:MinD superfamily P-loop ATPase|nr:ATP-binding protein [Marinifilaceae bacterium]